MKRLLTVTLAVALVFAFTIPASADFKMGIMSYTDVGYNIQSEDRRRVITGNPNADSKYTAFLDTPIHSRLYGNFSNENMGGYLELGLGFGGNDVGFSTGEDEYFRILYGWYKIGNILIEAGHTTPLGASRFNPTQLLGLNEASHIIMLGFGNLYNRTTQVNMIYSTGAFRAGIGINTPNETVVPLQGSGYQPTWMWTGQVDYRSKMFWATLSGSFGYFATDEEPTGADDNATAWEASLMLQFNLGMFKVRLMPFYGQNITNLGYSGVDNGAAVVDVNGQVEDTDAWGGYIDFTFGGDPFLVHLIGGYSNTDNDTFDDDGQQWAVGARGAWKVAANFTLSPEVFYYDYGDTVVGNIDAGSQILAGVQFQFVF
jgi:hypothetical protein